MAICEGTVNYQKQIQSDKNKQTNRIKTCSDKEHYLQATHLPTTMFQICKDTYRYKVISFYIVQRSRSCLMLYLPSFTHYISLRDYWYAMTTSLRNVGALYIIIRSTQITHSNELGFFQSMVVICWFLAIWCQFNMYFLRESEWSDIRYARNILQFNDHEVNTGWIKKSAIVTRATFCKIWNSFQKIKNWYKCYINWLNV